MARRRRQRKDGMETTTGLLERLKRTRSIVRIVLIVERLWPLLLPLAILAALFAVVSWFGLFRVMPDWARLSLTGAFALAAVASLFPLSRMRWPRGAEIDHRIERANALLHRPVTTQSDRLAAVSRDPFAEALWREHQKRLAAGLDRLSPGSPATGVPARDPWALRAIPALLLAGAFAFSLGPGGGTLTDAFSARGGAPVIPPRVDAWVTPPAYTGRAPVFLTAEANRAETAFTVPQGSTVVVRVTGGSGGEELSFQPSGEPAASPVAPDMATLPDRASTNSSPAGARQFSLTLEGDGNLRLATQETAVNDWRFTVIPDQPPEIALDGDPKREPNGSFTLTYTVKDDYGARSGETLFELAEDRAPDARPLYEAPEMPLSLPREREGEARTTTVMAEHPWAGASARMRLKVTDAAGQEGISEPLSITMPERVFTNPLAKAVIEQRRMLALDANRKPRVLLLLDSVTLRPEDTFSNMSHYLGLMALRSRLDMAETDDALRETVDYMWELAVQIEDGDLTDAERRLRDAQQALREALENGASDEEIERRIAELREALNEFLREFAERAQQDPNMAQQMPQDMQEMSQSDLDRMLQQMEDLAKSGQREQAEQLLSQLENMMRNLQAGRQQDGQQGQQGQMREQMNRLGELMRRQQEMMNETFRLDQMQRGQQGQEGQQRQGQRGQQGQQGQQGEQGQQQGRMGRGGQQPGQGQGGQQPGQGSGMTSEELAEALRGLQEGQGQLRGELGQLMEDLRGMGIEPGEGFGEAGERMGQAGRALGDADGEQAVGRQGEALEALRRGAQDMMNQMQQQAQQNGQGGSEPGGNNRADDRDPLGRPRATTGPDFGDTVKVPDEIDAQRAREILEAIRERLGNALSPQLEKEYLERLLDLQ